MWTVRGIMSRRRRPRRSLVESRQALKAAERRDERINTVADSLGRHIKINHLSDGVRSTFIEGRKP